MLLFSAAAAGFEKTRLAYNIGYGLERIGASVLIVDLDPATRQEALGGVDLPALLASKTALGTAATKDPATGVATLVAGTASGRALPAGESKRLLSEAAEHFEFILIIGKSLADPSYSAALAAMADKEIFAVSAAEAPAAEATLRQKYTGSNLARVATIVVEHGSERAEPRAGQRSAVLQSAIAELRRTNRFAELN